MIDVTFIGHWCHLNLYLSLVLIILIFLFLIGCLNSVKISANITVLNLSAISFILVKVEFKNRVNVVIVLVFSHVLNWAVDWSMMSMPRLWVVKRINHVCLWLWLWDLMCVHSFSIQSINLFIFMQRSLQRFFPLIRIRHLTFVWLILSAFL